MMGQSGGNQNRLFYSFKLEDHVPANHLLRDIDKLLDLTDLRAYLAPFYSHTGLASIAKPSPPASPSFMQRCSTVSNTCRKASLSRKRPCRFFENVELDQCDRRSLRPLLRPSYDLALREASKARS